jgi:carbonic anhydrase
MCDHHDPMHHGPARSRRTFLKASLPVAAASLLGPLAFGPLTSVAYGAALTAAQRDKMTPDEIIAHMKKGNQRFQRGERQNHDFLAQQRATAKGQHPAAVLLSCIDSRAPAETVMDLGIGDIFNSRVAGNIANDDILGSMEFACAVAGAKVVLVMGHTACGAIKGAIDNAELGNLTALLAKIRPAIPATSYTGDRSSKNAAFVDAVARTNVQLTVADIRKRSPVLADLEKKGRIKIAGSLYDLQTGAVTFYA